MLKRYQGTVGSVFRLADAIVIGLTWLASYWLRFNYPLIEVTRGLPKFETYAALLPLVMFLWSGTFARAGLYHSPKMLRRTQEAQLLIKAHLMALLLFIALTYLFSEYRYSRGVMLYFGILGAFALVSSRLILRNALRALRKRGFRIRKVLIMGEGGEGSAIDTLIDRLDKFPELGFSVAGILTPQSSTQMSLRGKPCVGHFSDISKAIEKLEIERVVIALSRAQSQELDGILNSLKDEHVEIQLVPDIHDYMTLGCEMEYFDGLPILSLNDSPLQGWGAWAKRATDVILSLFALLLISPLLMLLAGFIKLTSKGPVLYGQRRMGLDGKTFEMLKFRSMRTDAEDASGPVWAKASDDRRTPIGSFLRSTSLDELPQFWNVLRGEMSLVGPRPERPIFVDRFRGEIPHYMLRHKVKAGITGWAQVNGWRGNTSLSSRIECDLYYIRNWSYLLDWKILWLTIWKGFINRNAY